jgi:hypothetical protein
MIAEFRNGMNGIWPSRNENKYKFRIYRSALKTNVLASEAEFLGFNA